jgi:hypothetical protein
VITRCVMFSISLIVFGCAFWLFNIIFIIVETPFVGMLVYILDMSKEHILGVCLGVNLVGL